MFISYDVIIVGTGLSGAVMAERFAEKNKHVLIIDKRPHIGGNCYDFIDKETGILCNKYGPHFFHTNNEEVWNYVQKFSEWVPYEHRVLAKVDDKLVPVPVNITTVNRLFNKEIKTKEEMDAWLQVNQIPNANITNGKEMALSLVGTELYEKLYKNYTFKQWGLYPEDLKPEITARIPVRNSFDDRYFTDKFQALPKRGYTEFIKNILKNPLITVLLNTDFANIKHNIEPNTTVIYTGPIDNYFTGFPKLEYRSLNIVFERYKNTPQFQETAQINYPNLDEKFTRIIEFKHCLNQQSDHTIISKEYSTDQGEPYYPILNEKNLTLFNNYKILAINETKEKNVHYLGRLANYKYFNMDQAIHNSLAYFEEHFSHL